MSELHDADEALRAAVTSWCTVHSYEHPDALLGDLVVVAHFRSWDDEDTQYDDYEVIAPAGVSYHATIGLLSHGIDVASEAAHPDEA